MSSDSLALLRRRSPHHDLSDLAKSHIEHDLTPSDRERLHNATRKLSTHATVGSLIGLGLGLALAWRVRSNRMAYFRAFRAREKPVSVQFSDGRTETIPDITPLLKPSTAGDVATYLFFSAGGLFLGGETGLLTGSAAASRAISRDPEARSRVEKAFASFRADILRDELRRLEASQPPPLAI